MQIALAVTNNPDYSGATTPTAGSVQQTNPSDSLGFHAQQQASQPVDNQVMEFLKSEAAGSVYDTKQPVSHDYHKLGLIATGSALLVAIVLWIVINRRKK